MKVCFIIPDGVGIRNYLYSKILKNLTNQGHEIVVWHAISNDAIDAVESLHQIKINAENLPEYKESFTEKFYREVICFARLRYNARITDNKTTLSNWTPNPQNIKLKFFYRIVEFLGRFLFLYSSILFVERLHEKAIEKSKFLNQFKVFLTTHSPDVVFNTHQRAICSVPAVHAAKQLGIKTVGAIFSWDNLPKARLSTRTDYYVVWSNYMKEEMYRYYPEITNNRVIVTGTPQFDFYHDKALCLSRAEFCTRFGLDPNRPIVCFSGDDTKTSPYDPMYLRDLAVAVSSMGASSRPQILFRRCPVDLSDRFDDVLNTYSEIIKVADPLWNRDQENDSWAMVYPSFEDVELLVNTALHCDAVYNVGSTMAHDFAAFNKPAIYINYDQPNSKDWTVKTIYKFQHFRSMDGLDAVSWLNSKDEILKVLKEVLQTPANCSPDRRKWLEKITGLKLDASQSVATFLTTK